MLRRFVIVGFASAVVAASARGQNAELLVEKSGGPVATFTAATLQTLPVDTISVSSHGAPPVRYRVVKLLDVMAAAGTPIDSLKLGRTGWIVAAYAKDGYYAVFAAGELEPTLGPTRVFIAFERDGAPLADTDAPFRLIVPTDKKSTRSARMVHRIRIVDPLARP